MYTFITNVNCCKQVTKVGRGRLSVGDSRAFSLSSISSPGERTLSLLNVTTDRFCSSCVQSIIYKDRTILDDQQ